MSLGSMVGDLIRQSRGAGAYSGTDFAAGNAKQQLRAISADRGGLAKLRDSSFTASGNLENRMRRRAGQTASGAVAQGFAGPTPTSFGGALDTALRRTKVRSRIAQQGEAAINQQSLKDRIAIAQASRQREGDLLTSSLKAANIREGVNIGVADANQAMKNNTYGLAGAVLGGVSGVLANKEGREFTGGLFSRMFGSRGTPQPMAGGDFTGVTAGMA